MGAVSKPPTGSVIGQAVHKSEELREVPVLSIEADGVAVDCQSEHTKRLKLNLAVL